MMEWVHVSLNLADAAVAGGVDPADFWAEALGWPLGEPWAQDPELRSFAPPEGDAYVHHHRTAGRPGVHVVIEVDDVPARADALVRLGAQRVRATEGRHTLASPGGCEFGLVERADHRPRPTAVSWPAGHRTRLVQVCIDAPAAWIEREVDFWRLALDWRWGEGSEPEFVSKLFPDAGSPLQFLVQRLGDDDGGATTRAHLDLGSDDLAAEAARLVAAGATRMWGGDGWVTLRDPAGVLFCVTDNSPDAP